ncbi:MAG: DNA primase [Candidatus Paceibacterota bacterium]|jgi:DNA primase
MPGSVSETIKEKLDVADFLKGYLNLQPAGRNFKALCPFHKEKTPSFMISPERQNWHCFGCNLGGDIFSFLMRYENIEFAEALKILAERAGVELARVSSGEYKYFGLLYDINEAAKKYFQKELVRSESARKYLTDRGLKEETINEFEIGFAPNLPDALNLFFANNSNFRPDDILRAGLGVKSERGRQFDRFRGRVMFPICNSLGKVVGFTGRILPEFDIGQFGKYVNSPETPIFNKSKVLYGFSKSKEFIRDEKSVFMVEGQMDLLMSYQAGIKNVVATSGTALTPDHLKLLRRLTEEIVLNFDSDEAGLAAGERAIDLAESFDFNVKVVVLKDFKDPAEAVEKDPAGLLTAITKATPAPEFYFERYLPKGADYSSREMLRSLRVVLGKIKNIQSAVSREFWLKQLSKRVGISEKTLAEESEGLAAKSSENKEESDLNNIEERKISRRELLSERLISAALQRNNLAVVEDVAECLPVRYQNIVTLLERGDKRSPDPKIDQILNLVILRSEEIGDAELAGVKKHLRLEFQKDRHLEITAKIREAELNKDESSLKISIEELRKLDHV